MARQTDVTHPNRSAFPPGMSGPSLRALSVAGMLFAAAGLLGPVEGAVMQELIDIVAVGNALRTSMAPRVLTDFEHV